MSTDRPTGQRRAGLPLVSIVTPVHNARPYLAECIESVLRQTYPSWEHVIVDNASTDGSRELAERYAADDPRIRVLSTPRLLDPVDSQNFALEQISGASRYCKVVHADDWLFPECVMRMVEVAEAHPSVGIVSAYRLEGERVSLDGLPYPSTMVSGRELARRSLLGGPYVFGSPTSLLIRADIVRARRPFYTDRGPWTDIDVCYQILKAHDFGFVHQVLTFTRRHEASGSAASSTVNAAMLGTLTLLIRYGPEFLTGPEFDVRIGVVLGHYREFLLRSALAGRDRAFWAYHRQGLAAAGHPLKAADLWLAAVRMGGRRLFRPVAVAAARLSGSLRLRPRYP